MEAGPKRLHMFGEGLNFLSVVYTGTVTNESFRVTSSYPSTLISFNPNASFCSKLLSYHSISNPGSGSGAYKL
jgi:hypothetical protein